MVQSTSEFASVTLNGETFTTQFRRHEAVNAVVCRALRNHSRTIPQGLTHIVNGEQVGSSQPLEKVTAVKTASSPFTAEAPLAVTSTVDGQAG